MGPFNHTGNPSGIDHLTFVVSVGDFENFKKNILQPCLYPLLPPKIHAHDRFWKKFTHSVNWEKHGEENSS